MRAGAAGGGNHVPASGREHPDCQRERESVPRADGPPGELCCGASVVIVAFTIDLIILTVFAF